MSRQSSPIQATLTRAPAILYRHLHNHFLKHNGILFLLQTQETPLNIKKLFLLHPIASPLHTLYTLHNENTLAPVDSSASNKPSYKKSPSTPQKSPPNPQKSLPTPPYSSPHTILQTDKRFIVPNDVFIYLSVKDILQAIATAAKAVTAVKAVTIDLSAAKQSQPAPVILLYYDESSLTLTDLATLRQAVKSYAPPPSSQPSTALPPQSSPTTQATSIHSASHRTFELLAHPKPYTSNSIPFSAPFSAPLEEAACQTIYDVYAQCEMGAIFAYRFLKAHTPIHHIETECTHYLILKTKGAAAIRVTLHSIPFSRDISPSTASRSTDLASTLSEQTIIDPSVNIFNIALDWKGFSLNFIKTVTYATSSLPEAFTQRYQAFQQALEPFLNAKGGQDQFFTHSNHSPTITFFASVLSHGQSIVRPLTRELFQYFYTTPNHDVMNLIVQEQLPPNHDTSLEMPAITESLLIRKKLISSRKSQSSPQPTLHFQQEPPYNGALLNFF